MRKSIQSARTFKSSVIIFLFLCLPCSTALFAAEKEQAKKIINESGFQNGLVVEIDCDDGQLTAALGKATSGMVQGLDTEAQQVRQTRRKIRAHELGGRVSARSFDGETLPYADNLVNLIVATNGTPVTEEEIMRVLTPLGTAWIDG